MNLLIVLRFLGNLTLSLAALMAPSMICAACYEEWRTLAGFGASVGISAFLGLVLRFVGRRRSQKMFKKEALIIVVFGWLLTTAVGALPFVLCGVLDPLDAFFESVSGFTTTGSTVLQNIEGTAKGLLFWRSFTQWLGGLGIVLIFLVVLPQLGAGGRILFSSQSSTPDVSGLRKRIGDTARILYKVYLGLTVAQTLALMLAGMTFYDALCHTFTTLATGGFSPRQSSIAAYDSVAVEIIIILFMVLAGTNFELLFQLFRGNVRAFVRDSEWRIYIGILVVVTGLVALNLTVMQGNHPFAPESHTQSAGSELTPAHATRAAAFSVASIMTTTGFATDDFDQWPDFSRFLLILLMIIGGSTGSTSGGLKVARLVMLAKIVHGKIVNTFRPRDIRVIRFSGELVGRQTQEAVLAFLAVYVFVFTIAAALLAAIGVPFVSAVSAVAATLNGVGPGLEHVGATEDFHLVPDMGKWVLISCMLLGRLEIFGFIAIFTPSFWRRD